MARMKCLTVRAMEANAEEERAANRPIAGTTIDEAVVKETGEEADEEAVVEIVDEDGGEAEMAAAEALAVLVLNLPIDLEERS